MPTKSALRNMLHYAALGALACPPLAGCAHTNDVLAKPAEEVFHSAQPPAVVASCFETSNHIRIIEREDGARVARFRNGYGGVVKTFSIYAEGTGSRIEMRSDSINVPGYKWKRCVGLKPMKAAS